MTNPILDPQEQEAIRESLRASAPPPPSGYSPGLPPEATPVALIADATEAERTRPLAMRLGSRWSAQAQARVSRIAAAKFTFEATEVSIVEGAAARDELPACWAATVSVDGKDELVVMISGPMIDALAGRLAGGPIEDLPPKPAPSATSVKLFQPIGEAVVTTLARAWEDEPGGRLTMVGGNEEARRALGNMDLAVALTLTVEGPTRGRVRLLVPPTRLGMRAPVVVEPLAPQPPPPAVEEALSVVPLEVQVELGRAKLTMADFASLKPGDVITLDRFIEDPLPVRVGGQLKASGRAIVWRGVVAVEVVATLDEQE